MLSMGWKPVIKRMNEFNFYLEQEQERVNRWLDRLLPAPAQAGRIVEAMRYSVMAGGKRLRPILTLATAQCLDVVADDVIEVACAIEFIHTYSLIHDDLPAMDDSDLRRGKPTSHCVYGEALAILAGDALLTLAFEVLARYGLVEGREKMALQISAELARAAGAVGLIAGQVLDLAAEGSSLSVDALEQMYRLKTGALLETAVRSGALVAGASPTELQALTGYASCLGPAFQIADDLLDRSGTAAEIGKRPGLDQARGKATYPAIMGEVAARRRAEMLYQKAISNLDTLHRPCDLLRRLAHRLVYRTR